MAKNGFDIQTILTKRTDFQTNQVVLLGQVTENNEKVHHPYFLKFIFSRPALHTFGFARNTSQPFAKPKECKSIDIHI
jgi:hypothetical protein